MTSRSTTKELFVAVVVAVDAEHFSDDDDICLVAGLHVCGRLEEHLERSGHTIERWIRGGCEEDWGVYYQSRLGDETIEYAICFFPQWMEDGRGQMLVQYGPKTPFLRHLFRGPLELSTSHPLHETMRAFGESFGASRMLTQAQFDAEY